VVILDEKQLGGCGSYENIQVVAEVIINSLEVVGLMKTDWWLLKL
jgi:hypothetical protein